MRRCSEPRQQEDVVLDWQEEELQSIVQEVSAAEEGLIMPRLE